MGVERFTNGVGLHDRIIDSTYCITFDCAGDIPLDYCNGVPMTKYLVWQIVEFDDLKNKFPSADDVITKACDTGAWEVSEQEHR